MCCDGCKAIPGQQEQRVPDLPGTIFPSASCTCVIGWMAITDPPPCPVHGQRTMLRATC